MPNDPKFHYYAFISYRHIEPDRAWAKWLHFALETYRTPRRLIHQHQFPIRIQPIFRDEEELSASSDLSKEIEAALQASRFLIVICSPHTPASKWVNQEIVRFREMGRGGHILALLVAGEPSDSFPPALLDIRRVPGDIADRTHEEFHAIEPLAADVRPHSGESERFIKRMAKLRLVAGILGCNFDELRRRDQERHTRNLARLGVALGLLAVLLSFLTWYAFIQRAQAIAKTEESHQRLVRATVANGLQMTAKGDWFSSLPWLIEALNLDKGDSAKERIHRMRLASIFNRSPKLKHMLFHKVEVFDAKFSKDGRQLISSDQKYAERIWDTATGNEIIQHQKPQDYKSQENIFTDSEDGTRAIILDTEGRALVIDTATRQQISGPIQQPTTPQSGGSAVVDKAVLNANGQWLATADYYGGIVIWDANSGKPLSNILLHTDEIPDDEGGRGINHLEFSRDGKMLVTASDGGTAIAWLVPGGKPIAAPFLHGDKQIGISSVSYAAFSPDGERIVTACHDGIARVWNVKTGKLFAQTTPGRGPKRMLHQATFSPDGQRIVTAGDDMVARIWDARTGEPVSPPMLHGGIVNSAVYSPDGKSLLTTSGATVRLWDVTPYEPTIVSLPTDSQDDLIGTAKFSSDARRLATLDRKGVLKIWDTATWQHVSMETVYHKYRLAPAVNMSWSGKWLVISQSGTGTEAWDTEKKQVVKMPEQTSEKELGSIRALSTDGKRAVVESDTFLGHLRVYDTALWTPISPEFTESGPILDERKRASQAYDLFSYVAFDSKGERIFTASKSGNVQIRGATTAQEMIKPISQFQPPNSMTNLYDKDFNPVNDMELSPDGRWLLTAGGDHTGRLWDTRTGQPSVAAVQHDYPVRNASFNADGSLIVTICIDNTVRIWDATTGEAVTPPLLSGSTTGRLGDAAFSADGMHLLTINEDSTIRAWDIAPDARPLPFLRLYAAGLALQQIDEERGASDLNIPLESWWEEIRTKYPNLP